MDIDNKLKVSEIISLIWLYFHQGYVPAFVRLGPHTIITFIFFEQLRKNFGIVKQPSV